MQILAALIQRTDWSVVDKLLVEPIHATPNSLVAAAEPIAEKTAAPRAKTAELSVEIVEPSIVDP